MIEKFVVEVLTESDDGYDTRGYMERRIPGAAQHLRPGSTVAFLFRESVDGPVVRTIVEGTASAEMRDEIDDLSDA